MTPYQGGQLAFEHLGWIPHLNPHTIGTADWASWRNGHTAAQVTALHAKDRMAAKQTRAIGDHLPHGWEKRT